MIEKPKFFRATIELPAQMERVIFSPFMLH